MVILKKTRGFLNYPPPPPPHNLKQSINIKITNWDKIDLSTVDPGSKRRGRITQDFQIASFFEDVKYNEFGY